MPVTITHNTKKNPFILEISYLLHRGSTRISITLKLSAISKIIFITLIFSLLPDSAGRSLQNREMGLLNIQHLQPEDYPAQPCKDYRHIPGSAL